MRLTEAEELALTLINKTYVVSGKSVNIAVQFNYRFKWDRSKRRFGLCSYRDRTIQLSGYLVALNNKDEVLDTILHEIAHAIANHAFGCHGHGAVWKMVCREIGARPKRCYDDNVVVPDLPARAIKYHLVNKETGKVYKKYKKKPADKVIRTIHRRAMKSDLKGTRGKLAFIDVKTGLPLK